MTAQVVVYRGPAAAGKSHELILRFREALESSDFGFQDVALWIAPNFRTRQQVRDQLIDAGLDACLCPDLVTFDELKSLVLSAAGDRRRPIPPLLQRELFRRAVAGETEHLRFYAAAAQRAGFIDILAEHIRELKRRDIRPEDYARAAPSHRRADQHRELLRLYSAYEQLLATHQLLDSESAHWAARDALATGECQRFQNLGVVVVDGFTDFTPTQHGVLSQLARHAKQLFISLLSDSNDQPTDWRTDLFAKTEATLAELRRHHPKLVTREFGSRATGSPALDHVTRGVFLYPPRPPSAETMATLDRLNFVAAASDQDEIVQIARRIKKLLSQMGTDEGSSPSDIVVVFRTLPAVAPRIREVFTQFGIPYALEAGMPLAGVPVVKTLLSLLRLHQDDWPFGRVVSVLTNNMLRSLDGSARQAAEWLVRDLQYSHGREKLLERVHQLAAEVASDGSEHRERRSAAAKTALPPLEQLDLSLARLPKEATLTEWCAALARLGADLGVAPFNSPSPRHGESRATCPLPEGEGFEISPSDSTDQTAWNSIVAHCTALQRLDGWLGEPPRQLTQGDLLSTLLDVVSNEMLPQSRDDVGRVRVLSAHSARNIAARHLFLAGMSEQAFPSPGLTGRLADEADYRFFYRAAHQPAGDQMSAPAAPLAPTRAQEEMLLFYEVISRAQQTLTISYPALDDKAQPLPPSPYVIEIERALGKEAAEKVQLAPPQLSPVPDKNCIGSSGDWRIAAVAEALRKDGDRSLLAGLFSAADNAATGRAIDAGLRIVHARARGESFGPAEGMFTSPAAAARLAKRFGGDHPWSASQLETYAGCPYKFYLQDVLRLEPLGDLALETDALRRGSLVHHVLAAFHRRFGAAPGDAWTSLQRDQVRFLAELKTTLQAVIDVAPRSGIEGALVELDRRQIDKWLANYREHHEKYDGAWREFDVPPRPAHFELRFGRKRSGDSTAEDPKSVDNMFPLDIGGETIYIAGRIDRIDIGQVGDRTIFNVIDYKSGKRPTLNADKLASGECLQPALYVMAAEALVFGVGQATPLWAGYWSMQSGTTTKAGFSLRVSDDRAVPTEEWKKLRPQIIERIGEFVRSIRRGEFPVDSLDPDCTSRCDYRTVCRVAQVRSMGKTMPM